jgi:hypothetical protein
MLEEYIALIYRADSETLIPSATAQGVTVQNGNICRG